MKHKLLLSASRRWGNISNTAHSFSSFAHSFGHLKLLVLSRGGRSKQLLLIPHPLLIPAAKFRELKCSALSSLLAPPQSTSVVNFPPGTRDDAFLDYISRGQQRGCQSAEPDTEGNLPRIQLLRSSTLGTNCQPLVSEQASFSPEPCKRNSFNY